MMTTTVCPVKITTGPAFRFFQLFNQTPGLNGRDNREKPVRRCGHSLALILTGFGSRFIFGLVQDEIADMVDFPNRTYFPKPFKNTPAKPPGNTANRPKAFE